MNDKINELRALFGDYRAEWPQDRFADLFVRPEYYSKLEVPRPCFLFGGRGTGKTTALRSLRFDATATRVGTQSYSEIGSLPYLGVYIKMNKNQVRAFDGPDLTREQWMRCFAHYFNLLVAQELTAMVLWAEQLGAPSSDWSHVATSLGAPAEATTSADSLGAILERSVASLELFVNNPSSAPRPMLTIAESPIVRYARLVHAQPWAASRQILCCVDEYENLLHHHQAVVNTYVKHAGPPLSYKIGVRSNGLHSRATIDNNDVIRTPDDYVEIDIAQQGFEGFARKVAQRRLDRARAIEIPVSSNVDDLLEELQLEREAELLGAERHAATVRAELTSVFPTPERQRWLAQRSSLELAFVEYWRAGHPTASVINLVDEWIENPADWATRVDNHGYSALFWLSRGRKGARIKKYYAGIGTILLMASGNIRYFLELIDRSIAAQFPPEREHALKGNIVLSAASQTHAAREAGRQRLDQLEGLSEYGGGLKRLVLGVGRIFFEYARTPEGHSPERNLFVLVGEPPEVERAARVLADGVSHLAFEATPRTKAMTAFEPKDDEYRLHPIFAGFFEFSHRRKRHVRFDAAYLLVMMEDPARGLRLVIKEADLAPEDELPDQMALFSQVYEPRRGD